MGSRGPVPKREKQRRRRNKDDGPPPKGGPGSGRDEWEAYARSCGLDVPEGATRAEIQELVADGGDDVQWHPLARRWYESLRQSGQSVFYEPSDWAFAAVIAEAMSRELSPQPMVVGHGEDAYVEMVTLPPKGTSLKAWLSAATSLLATEGARRRMRVELERPDDGEQEGEGPAPVTDIRSWRESLNA